MERSVTLVLFRHQNPPSKDERNEIGDTGRDRSYKTGELIKGQFGLVPNLAISSPQKRAIDTVAYAFKGAAGSIPAIYTDERLMDSKGTDFKFTPEELTYAAERARELGTVAEQIFLTEKQFEERLVGRGVCASEAVEEIVDAHPDANVVFFAGHCAGNLEPMIAEWMSCNYRELGFQFNPGDFAIATLILDSVLGWQIEEEPRFFRVVDKVELGEEYEPGHQSKKEWLEIEEVIDPDQAADRADDPEFDRAMRDYVHRGPNAPTT